MFLFTGTFSRAQVGLLVTWIQHQVPNIDARIDHLLARMRRVGFVKMEFDGEGYPTSYQPMFRGSLIEKLLGAYEAAGGDLARDFRVRMYGQSVSHARASIQQGGSTQYTDGSLIRSTNMDDVIAGDLVSSLKKPFIEVMKRKRQVLEYRIKVAQDLYDQLNTEVALLKLAQYQPQGLMVDQGEAADTTPTEKSLQEAKGEKPEGEAFEQMFLSPEQSIEVLVQQIQTVLNAVAQDEFRSAQTTVPHDIFGLKVKPLMGFAEEVTDLGALGPEIPATTTGSAQ